MSVNYDLYETPDLTKSGEDQPLHARVVLKGSYTAEEFVEQVVVMQHVPHAQVVGVIEAISKELKHLLLKGFSVELGDVGYFTLSDECRRFTFTVRISERYQFSCEPPV